VSEYRLVTLLRAVRDVEGIVGWYEGERPGLGLEFLEELRATYAQVLLSPFGYQVLRSDLRRALVRRFPYAVFFAIEGDSIVIARVLHTSRNPGEWQRGRD
jgi:plasmid stabilization system protein ParE